MRRPWQHNMRCLRRQRYSAGSRITWYTGKVMDGDGSVLHIRIHPNRKNIPAQTVTAEGMLNAVSAKEGAKFSVSHALDRDTG